jgi:hypothetical protein
MFHAGRFGSSPPPGCAVRGARTIRVAKRKPSCTVAPDPRGLEEHCGRTWIAHGHGPVRE